MRAEAVPELKASVVRSQVTLPLLGLMILQPFGGKVVDSNPSMIGPVTGADEITLKEVLAVSLVGLPSAPPFGLTV